MKQKIVHNIVREKVLDKHDYNLCVLIIVMFDFIICCFGLYNFYFLINNTNYTILTCFLISLCIILFIYNFIMFIVVNNDFLSKELLDFKKDDFYEWRTVVEHEIRGDKNDKC